MNQTIKKRITQIAKGEVPVGYKKTEIGVVPEKWEETSLGNLFDFYGGLGIARDQLGAEGIPYLHYGDMHRGTFTKATYNAYSLRPRYDIKLKGDEHYLLKNGDVVFLDASEDLSGTSRCVVVENPTDGLFISGLHTFIAKPKNDALSLEYKQYLTEPQFVKKQFEEKSVGFKVYGMNRTSIKSVKINYPKSLSEQNRIAEILTTQDTLIEQQEKLIEQKQAQKKYLMQVLLTGKKRLKGFSGEWEEKQLGNISQISTGNLNANAMESNGKYPFFTCAKESYFINSFAFDTEAILISGNGANVGYVHYYKGKFNAYQRTYVLDNILENIFFIKFFLEQNLHLTITKEKSSGNTPYIVLGTIQNMRIFLPPLPEQEAIANRLSIADQEIELLQKQLEQEKNKKKSLMQLLLTGVVRV